MTVLGVRLRQRGLMWTRPGARPMRFVAEHHMDAGRVAFRWRARFGAGPLRPFVVVDEILYTGQNPQSSKKLTAALIDALS